MSIERLHYLKWDSEFFSRPIYNYTPAATTQETLILDKATAVKGSLIQAKVPAQDLATIDQLQSQRFVLVESECAFKKHLPPQPMAAVKQQTNVAVNAHQIGALAAHIFLKSRYRTPWFAEKDAARLYQQWAINAVTKTFDDVCLIETVDKQLAGFITARMRPDRQATIGLIGTNPKHRGQGVAKRLLTQVESWARAQGATALCVATQGSNDAAIQCYLRQQYDFSTLSFWFYRQQYA